jgi:adenylate cyclase
LVVRIGLASGEAFVGDYGSRTKLDYTCIGDTVNVAARLEDANKFFGTRVLVNQATRSATGAAFAFRYLGRVLLLGKQQAVETYELLGRATELDGSMTDFVSTFEQAVRSFQSQSWQDCDRALERCRLLRPQDELVGIYEGASRAARRSAAANASGVIRSF